MPTVKLTRNTIVAGKVCSIGDVVDASKRDATLLVSIGKAVAVPEPEEAPGPDAELEAEKAEAMTGGALIATAVPGGRRRRKGKAAKK